MTTVALVPATQPTAPQTLGDVGLNALPPVDIAHHVRKQYIVPSFTIPTSGGNYGDYAGGPVGGFVSVEDATSAYFILGLAPGSTGPAGGSITLTIGETALPGQFVSIATETVLLSSIPGWGSVTANTSPALGSGIRFAIPYPATEVALLVNFSSGPWSGAAYVLICRGF